jgi:long-chain fatty acid transport protein
MPLCIYSGARNLRGKWPHLRLAIALATVMGLISPAWGQGVALRAVSTVTESMGGAVTAAPVDAAGAIHFNPASMSGLNSSEMSFSMGVIIPQSELSSRLGPYSGSTRSEPGAVPAPSMAMVWQQDDSPWTFGFGAFAVGGSRVNYPASLTNPILMPQQTGIGLGRLSAEVEVHQLVPAVSYQVSDRMSIGFAPTIAVARMVASPLFLAAKNPGTPAMYPEGVGTRYIWGGGFELGVYYVTENDWHLGASFSSPQWVESFRYKSTDQLGRPRDVKFHLDYPMILSTGVAYSGFERWVLSCDVRYFNYANTPGFKDYGVSPTTGALLGLDWENIMGVSLGAQRQVTDHLYVRFGYAYNDNPIDSEAVQYNVASPLIVQHSLHTGLSYMFADNWMANLAYVHCFESEVAGPLHGASGPIPGSEVKSTASADVVSFGFTKRF